MEEREEAEWVGRERRGMDYWKDADRSFGVDGYQAPEEEREEKLE